MSLNDTPAAGRLHIGFFGRRNAGKSSLVNAITDQDLAVVSDVRGTTTDPVSKSMELLPLGPVQIIDTPGFDDVGALGALRVEKTRQILRKTDLAVLVADATQPLQAEDRQLLALFRERKIPYLIAYNKCDLLPDCPIPREGEIYVSALRGLNITQCKQLLGQFAPKGKQIRLVGDLISGGDTVVLVTPIDESAPKGRMILPQQQAIRDILDAGAAALVTQPDQLPGLLAALRTPPRLVITDSQAFAEVAAMLPAEMPLTSFSILMARYKGYLSGAVAGAAALDRLQDGDRILMAEGCTHHRQCNDIGTVKIPNWLRQHTGKRLEIATCSGGDFPQDLTPYAVIIHCGGCMLNDREIAFRQQQAMQQGVPFTNYGVTVAKMKGILARSLAPLAEIGECI